MRFFWIDKLGNLTQWRMTVHVFGAVSSPSVANYALRHSAKYTDDETTKTMLHKNFYVDDLLSAFQSETIAIQEI